MDDLPELAPCVLRWLTTMSFVCSLAGSVDEAWADDCPPALLDKRRDAYVWCRHDLDVCIRTAPTEPLRTWDAALGSIPRDVARQWAEAPPPPRRRPVEEFPPPRVSHTHITS